MLLSIFLAICLDLEPTAVSPLPSTGMKSPLMVISEEGEIWIWDYWDERIECFDRDGRSLRVFHGARTSPRSLFKTHDLVPLENSMIVVPQFRFLE